MISISNGNSIVRTLIMLNYRVFIQTLINTMWVNLYFDFCVFQFFFVFFCRYIFSMLIASLDAYWKFFKVSIRTNLTYYYEVVLYWSICDLGLKYQYWRVAICSTNCFELSRCVFKNCNFHKIDAKLFDPRLWI